MLVSDMISRIRNEGGFDSTATNSDDSSILGWINEAYREMVTEAKWLKAVRTLTPISAGGSTYAIPDDVSDVRSVRISGTGTEYALVNLEDLWSLKSSAAYITPSVSGGGAFTANYEADTDPYIELWPASGGVSVEALVSVIPSALGTGDTPKVPDDLQPALIERAIAIGLDRVYSRPDLAAPKTAAFNEAKQKLTRRANSRIGSGPKQARIYGVNV